MAAGVHAALNTDSSLFTWLEEVKVELRGQWGEIEEITGPFGIHGVVYDDEGEGPFATVGFVLPDGVYAEIENAYGMLEGFRVYQDDSED